MKILKKSKKSKKSKKYKKSKINIKNCCLINDKNEHKYKECLRKDGIVFKLPRKYNKSKCVKTKKKGFTMRSSCAIYKLC